MQMEQEKKKNHAAVMLGRLGGRVKSEAKARAARENGLLGGPDSWTKPRELWKKTVKPRKIAPQNLKVTEVPQPLAYQRILSTHRPR
jgi:hypothetical protein